MVATQMTKIKKIILRIIHLAPHVMRRGLVFGYCPICEKQTFYYLEGVWIRDQLFCARCRSIPRWRALIHVLETFFPDWRDLSIHESSPGGPASEKISSECKKYVPTHYFPDIETGKMKDGFLSMNIEHQDFKSESFDLVITQDVFEHVLHPDKGFEEIARTLKPGGAHVFTVPWYYWKETFIRANAQDGEIKYLAEPEYHGNPIDDNGSLVITEWGWGIVDYIYKNANLTTTVLRIQDKHLGIDGEFVEVFISRKIV